MHSKAAMRQILRSSRQALGRQERERADAAICTHLTALLARQGATQIAAYVPEDGEPGGELLLPTLGKLATVWLPVIQDHSLLHWGTYAGPQSLKPGRFGIPAPEAQRDSSVLHELDLIVVPAMGARPDGTRIGRGAGFYDRALEGVRTPTVVLLYPKEVREDIPAQPHDAAADFVLTPDGTVGGTGAV
ncbi:5-formyltetrahydrofolate cyclo-ligase [Corynebacterium sp. 35RC1]|nr:5-formyltetrahydrofolate cyclo-ligase [Corynebacterium sp. 35RC1]